MTTRGRGRRLAAIGVAVLAVAGGCSSKTVGRDPYATPPRDQGGRLRIDTELISSLETFDTCDDLLAYFRTEGAEAVGPYGFDGGGGPIALTDEVATATGGPGAGRRESATTAAPAAAEADTAGGGSGPVAGTDYSGTNVQEEGVDEPDLVKTDGKRLVTIAGGQLRVVDLTGPEPRVAATLRLGSQPYLDGQLLLAGDRVLVLRPHFPDVPTASPSPEPVPRPGAAEPDTAVGSIAPVPPYGGAPARTAVTAVDIADLAAPEIVEEVVLDGSLVAARMVGGVARLVLRSGSPDLPFLAPGGSERSVAAATANNRRVIAESTLEDWLPTYSVSGAEERRLTDCRDIARPEVFSGVGMLTVVSVDAQDPRPGPGSTVLGAGEIVYASAEHLYVTSTAWDAQTTTTDVHRFDISDPVRTTYLASGRVAGRLLNSFSMSEHAGDLRVATTDDAAEESSVTVLRQQDRALGVVGAVGGLGKTERIYAVRFLGDRGYVVTFRQTDPLYVLDLADPAAPKVTGELKIPGYSAYLHPIGDHRLIGVGQDASDQGRVQGTQVSLFDVSDPADPRRLANATLPQTGSEAEYDHHAFLWWAPSSLAVLPVQDHRTGTSEAVGFRVADGEVQERGRVTQRDRQAIRRSIVLGDRLLTLSETGLQVNDLETLGERSWTAF